MKNKAVSAPFTFEEIVIVMIMFVTGKKSLNPLPLRNVQQVTSPYNTETDQVEVVFLI